MNIKLRKQATTTPKIRAEIQVAPANISDSELARQFNVTDSTIRRSGAGGTVTMFMTGRARVVICSLP